MALVRKYLKLICSTIILSVLILSAVPAIGEEPARPVNTQNLWNSVKSDYDNFYSSDSMFRLTTAFIMGGFVANTNLDNNFMEWYRDDAYRADYRTSKSDEALFLKNIGDGIYTIPLAAALTGVSFVLPQDSAAEPVAAWGREMARAYALGLPVVGLSQYATGGSHYGENIPPDSRWHPFEDNNGVSGHTFIGAVPFLTLGQMVDNPLLKYSCYAASMLPGVTRINDQFHFLSQVFLGWYVAWESVYAVNKTEEEGNGFKISPLVAHGTTGFQVSLKW